MNAPRSIWVLHVASPYSMTSAIHRPPVGAPQAHGVHARLSLSRIVNSRRFVKPGRHSPSASGVMHMAKSVQETYGDSSGQALANCPEIGGGSSGGEGAHSGASAGGSKRTDAKRSLETAGSMATHVPCQPSSAAIVRGSPSPS